MYVFGNIEQRLCILFAEWQNQSKQCICLYFQWMCMYCNKCNRRADFEATMQMWFSQYIDDSYLTSWWCCCYLWLLLLMCSRNIRNRLVQENNEDQSFCLWNLQRDLAQQSIESVVNSIDFFSEYWPTSAVARRGQYLLHEKKCTERNCGSPVFVGASSQRGSAGDT